MLAFSTPARPRFAYGLWRYRDNDVATAAAMLALARGHGIDHFDTANVYGGESGFGAVERLMGAVRRKAPELFEGAVIATKAGVEHGVPYDSSAGYLKAACEASLERLGVERVDLFYIHRPDLLAHPAEVAGALDGLVAAGKAGAIGVSNFTVAQVQALSRYMKAPIAAHQLEFSAAEIDPLFDGRLDQAMERGNAVTAWSPLAGGRLGEGGPPELAPVRVVLDRLGEKYGVPPTAVALAFLLRHPAPVTPILGTKVPARLRDCLKAATIELSRPDWYAILEARRGARMP